MGLDENVRASIYEEHLDEASFLYEQRTRFLEDPEVTLDHVAELDARLEAHVDGLVLGGAQALAMCRERAAGEDFGVQHAALRVFCRTDARDAALATLAHIKDGEPSAHAAASDALSAELPASWSKLAEEALLGDDPRLLSIWARAIGYRRLPLAAPLLATAARVEPLPPSCAWALGELRDAAAEPALLGCLWRGEAELAQAAAVALLKCRSKVGAGEIDALASRGAASLAVPLALSERGSHGALRSLAKQAQPAEREQALLAFGLLGDPAAIPTLVEQLGDEALGKAAAAALLLIAGNPLTEQAAEEPDEADPADDDLAKPAPSEADAAPAPPALVTRICRDPARWQEWLAAREDELAKHGRLRMGGPMTARATALALASTALPLRLRAWLADELLIRFGVESSFRPDMPAAVQRELLNAIANTPQPVRS